MSTLENAGEFSPTASVQVATGATSRALHLPRFGRTFFNPIVDVLLVCGGLSIPFLLFEWQDRSSVSVQGHTKIAIFVLFNFAHFASSTVRLYTKPGASAKHRFLAYGFPVVALVVTLFAIAFPEAIGRQLIALMLTWSPYHYAAQAYGLALMYGYQSGMRFSALEKRWLFWICLLPFIRSFLNVDDTSVSGIMGVSGVFWLVPDAVVAQGTLLGDGLRLLVTGLTPLVFAMPIAFACFGRARLPLVALVLVLMNALWLTAFTLFDAIVWASVAHSVQYLLVVTRAHVKDRARSVAATGAAGGQMVFFYVASILVGVFLFLGVPAMIQEAAVFVGLNWESSQCLLMVVAAINLHHFIVDGYIWRAPPRTSAASLPAAA